MMDKLINKSTNIASDFEYKKVEDNNNCIYIKTNKREYEIKNREDLINFGLKHAYISFDLLKQYCRLFHEPQFEIRFLLNDRDIKLTSDKINFIVCKASGLDKVAEDKGETDEDGLIQGDVKINTNHKTSDYKSNIRINEDINIDKVIILNLRLNEIMATFLNIAHVGNRIDYISSKNFLNKHLSEFEKIGFLIKENNTDKKPVYIVTEECANISKKLKTLINIVPNKNLFMNKKIMTKKNIKILFNHIREDFIKFLERFDDFRFLLRLIDDLDNIGRYTMMDIVKYCIENKYESEFIQIFIGDKGTAGKEAIMRGRDICYDNINIADRCNCNCNICYTKHNINSGNGIDKLLYVRDNVAYEKYQEITTSKNLEILVDDPLTLKFLVRFGITYYNKNILRVLDIISSKAYMKSTGKYCPYKDEWRVNKNAV